MRKIKMRLPGFMCLVFMIVFLGNGANRFQYIQLSGAQKVKPKPGKVTEQRTMAVNPSIFPAAAPESQGISAEALSELSNIVKDYVKNEQVVGAELLVVKNRHTVLHEAFGWMDKEENKPMGINTLFNIRSMTKPLTGAGIQLLVDQGKLSLTDPAAKYIPGFKNDKSKNITIEQLLTHRSGLPLTIMATLRDTNKFKDLVTMANAVGKGGTRFKPGTKFWYSDAGTNVLGAVIEVVSNRPLDQFIGGNLLKSLNMLDTRYNTEKSPIKSDRVASLYAGTVGAWKKVWTAKDEPFYPFAWGSQTLFGTPQDYARFLAFWLDKGKVDDRQLLSKEAVLRTLTPVSRMTALGSDMKMPTGFPRLKVHYGQMAMVYLDAEKNRMQPVVIGHNGSDGTFAWAWPKQELMILYFTQSRGQATGLRLEKHIDRLLINPGSVSDPAPVPENLKFYLGKYTARTYAMRNAVYEVSVQNGSLAIDIPGQMVFELKEPDAEGRWAFKLTPNVKFTFKRSEAGVVEGMEMNQVTVIPKKQGEIVTTGICPEKFRAILGEYVIYGQVLAVSWQKKGLSVDVPGEGIVVLKGPDEKGRWQAPDDATKVIYFERTVEGKVKSLNLIQTFQFKKGVAAAVLVEKVIKESGIEAGISKYRELKENPPKECYFDERSFNTLGNKLMNGKKMDEAIAVFELTAKTYPNSWNVYDSLGDAYTKKGNKELAIKNYRKSLELNPQNTTARKRIDELQENKKN
ncbi:MAG: class A beta-lactamase-related serine hydrolase [Candidatus Aminicenantes bacterium]|nr:class A beta-lactamase-related serine hydrolase [Candidatus Aminicenantes bacterium]